MEALSYKLHEPWRETPVRVSTHHSWIHQASAQQQLNEMERMGLVTKETFAEVPPRVEYSLTDRGRSLLPIIRAMDTWGLAHAHLFDVYGQLK